MANPVREVCLKNVFTKVLSNKTEGRVHIQVPDTERVQRMTMVFGARKDAGQPPPLSLDEAFFIDDNNVELEHDVASDLYLYPQEQDLPVLIDA